MERKIRSFLVVILITTLFPYSLWAQSGSVSVFSGNFNLSGGNDGPRLQSKFNRPSGAVFDSKGNLYIVEFGGERLRRIDKDGMVATLFEGGFTTNDQGTSVIFNGPSDIIVAEKDTLFISDQTGNKIRRVDSEGKVVDLAGSVFGFRDANGSQAQFRSPSDLALGANGNIYVADQGNHRIRMVDRQGNVTTILGDGSSQTRLGAMGQAVVASPRFIDFDKDGNLLIASQYDLYKLDFSSDELVHLIGQGTPNRFYDGFKSEAHFNDIKDLYVNESGIVYIGDGRVLRQYTEDGYLVTVSGNMSNVSLGGDELGNAAYVDVIGLVQRGADSLFIMDQTRHVAYLVRVNNGVSIQNTDINSDVTWTKEDSPHVVTEDITISGGAKLTIEPGAIVKRNLEAGITVKGAISAEGQEGDSIYFSDGHDGNLLVGRYFLTFEEANLSQSKLAFISVKSQNARITPLIRVGNEVTSRTTAITPISGHLDIENLYFSQAQILTDSRSTTASLKLHNSSLENAKFFVLGKESVDIDNVLITNSDLKNDERLTLSNSTMEGGNIFLKNTTYSNNSVGSTVVINSTLKESGIAANEAADLEISDSELLNTAIYVPSGNLKITDVKSTLDRQYSRIRKPNGSLEYFSHFVTAGSAQISGLFLSTNENKNGIYITGENSRNPESSLMRSTLKGDRAEALLQYKQEKDLTISSTNFLSTRNMINNFSGKTINASGNYFKGLLDSAAIEQEVYHVADNSAYGLVDFSDPSATRFFGPIILGPEVKFGRLFADDYLDDVAVRFNSVDPKTEKLLVYKHNVYQPENLTFLTEVSAPFEGLRTPYEENISYAVIAEDSEGKQADIEYVADRYISMQIVGARITIDEDEEYEFQIKVVADPADSVAVSVSEISNTELISHDDININFSKEDGDTTFFQVRLKPLPEAFGFTSINFRATDGISSNIRSISQNVTKINEFKPVIDGVDPVTGLFTDRLFEISHTTLSPFVRFSDQDGGEVYIKITSVVNGTLTKGGSEIQNSETIPYYRDIYSPLGWTPPANQSGLIDAFKIRVYDEDFESEEEVTIQFQVELNTPPIITKIDTTNRNYEDQYHYVQYHSFKGAVEYTDEQGDDILFVVTEVLNGNLWKSTQPEDGQITLPYTLSGEGNRSFLWLPPADRHGRIAAFKVKAADVSDVSDIEHTVYFDVRPSNDAPYFDFISDPEPKIAIDTLHTIAITGVSPGPFEEEQTVSLKVTSSDQSMLPNNQVDVTLKENGNADLIYLPVEGVQGSVQLVITLRDSEGSTSSQKVTLNFLEPDSPPVINMEDSYTVFVGNSLRLVPDISDDRSVVSSRIIGEAPSWLTADEGPRMASLSFPKHYSDNFKNGVINQATFSSTAGIVVDNNGNLIVNSGSVIRKVSPDGLATTWVGDVQKSGFEDGIGLEARFYGLLDLAYDGQRDIVYALDAGNRAIRKINASGEVSTVFKITDNREYGYMRSLTVDEQGNVYFGTDSPSYRIFKIDSEGNVEPYAGNGDSYGVTLQGDKDEVAIGQTYGMHALGDAIYFTSFGLFGRIDRNGQMTQIELPETFTSDGHETFLFSDGTDKLWLHKRAGSEVLRFNIADETFETIVGQGEEPFEENVATADFEPQAAGSSGYRITGIASWGAYQVFSLSHNNSHQLTVSRQSLDTLKGDPTAADIGTYELVVEASDIAGTTSRKTITFNVLANNQISATNVMQQLSFTEGVTTVDPADITLSGMADGELARVSLRLSDKRSGKFSTDSGNGELFTESTGVWEVTGGQSQVNNALAALSFEPDPDFELSSEVGIEIVNANGGVPLNGLIELNVTAVNDPTRLSSEIESSAFVAVPYRFEMGLEDPDTKMFNLRINNLPDWLTYSATEWVENYAGFEQETYWPGEADGDLTTARFNRPGKIFADKKGNMYVIERYQVKKITLDGRVSTYLRHQGTGHRDGMLGEAVFGTVSGMIFDEDNNMILADNGARRLRKISEDGVVTTLAGNGTIGSSDDTALNASFTILNGLEFDNDGNLYILDNNIIRKLDTNGQVTTVAGNRSSGMGEGSPLEISFFNLRSIAMNSEGDLIIADDRTIRKWNLQTNQITMVVGNGNNACCNLNDDNTDVYFRDLIDIRLDEEDNLYGVVNGKVFKVDFETGRTSEIGNGTVSERTGPADLVDLGNPSGIELLGDNLFISDLDRNVIRRVYKRSGVLEGVPLADDLGEHTVTYQLVNGRKEETEVNATITVFNNDFPGFKGIDSTYIFIEDEELTLAAFQMADNTNDQFFLELRLSNREVGQLKIEGFDQLFDENTQSWKLAGYQDEINEALSALFYIPAEHNHSDNIVELRSMRDGGEFERFGQLILKGVSINDRPELGDVQDQRMVSGALSEIDIELSDADGDMPVVTIDPLPGFLSLNRDIASQVTTFAGASIGSNYGEGPKTETRMTYPNQLVLGPGSELFLSENQYIRTVTNDSLKFYSKVRVGSFRGITDILFRGQQLYVLDRTAIYTFDEDGTTTLVAGNVDSGDLDGAPTDARFSYLGGAAPGPGVRDMYLLDQNVNKIKYMDDDFNVTTVFSPDDDTPVKLYDPVKMTMDGNGVYWILDRSQRILSFTHGGQLKEEFSVTSNQIPSSVWRSFTGIQIDTSGNIILYGWSTIYMLDQNGQIKRLTSPYGIGLEGETSVVNIGYIRDLLFTENGKVIYSDGSANRLLRTIEYGFDYSISGTPADSDLGEYTLTLSADDGKENGLEAVEFKLIVEGSDKPSVTNLSQQIVYEEDADIVTFDPIIISSEDAEQQFEVTFLQTPYTSGQLSSSESGLREVINNPDISLRGNAVELNEVLEGLFFKPSPNNVVPTDIEISIKQVGGLLDSAGVLNLAVTPINDSPEIYLDVSDTTAFVGIEIAIPIVARDIDGATQFADEHDLPDWLKYRTSVVKDDLVAGIPGKAGLTNGPALESKLLMPQRLDIDSNGNVYLLEWGSKRIRKISKEGQVSVFAGTGVSGYTDGNAQDAQFGDPADLAIDYWDNVYVSDPDNYVIRKISADGSVTTFAGTGTPGYKDGDLAEASFGAMGEMAFDKDRTKLFVHDEGNGKIRVIDLFSGHVSTVNFTGSGASAVPNTRGIAISPQNELYLRNNRFLIKSDLNGENTIIVNSRYSITTDGPLEDRAIDVAAMAFSSNGDILLSDLDGRKLRVIQDNRLVTLVDADQDGYSSGYDTDVRIGFVTDIKRLPDGSFLIVDSINNIIRRIEVYPKLLRGTPAPEDVGGYLATFAIKDAEGLKAVKEFRVHVLEEDPLHVSGLDQSIIMNEGVEALSMPTVLIHEAADQVIELTVEIATGSGTFGISPESTLPYLADKDLWYATASTDSINRLLASLNFYPDEGTSDNILTQVKLRRSGEELAAGGYINFIFKEENRAPEYVGESELVVHAGEVFDLKLLAEDANGDSLAFSVLDLPEFLVADSIWYLQEYYSPLFSIYMDEAMQSSQEINAQDMVLNAAGEILFVDGQKRQVRKLTRDFQVHTLAGSGMNGVKDGLALDAEFSNPSALTYAKDSALVIADTENKNVRKLSQTGEVTTLSGSGEFGPRNGIGSHVSYTGPVGITADVEGNIFLADFYVHNYRKIKLNSLTSSYAGVESRIGFADGPLDQAIFKNPSDIQFHEGVMYLSDAVSLRMINEQNLVQTIAGQSERLYRDGRLSEARFKNLNNFIPLESGLFLVSDTGANAIRQISLKDSTVNTVALGIQGDAVGQANPAGFGAGSLVRLPDGSVLMFDTINHRFLKLVRSTPVLSVRPEPTHLGMHDIKIVIHDGKGGETEHTIRLEVVSANTPPEAISIPDITETYAVDGTITIPLFDFFSDAEDTDSELTYEVVSNTNNTVVTSEAVDSADGILTLNVENAGTTQLEVEATDSNGASVSTNFAVTIEQAVATISITNTEFVNDGDEKTVTVTTNPVDLSYTITYDGNTTVPSAIGIYEVLVSLDERNYSGTATAQLSIVNVAPEDLTLSGSAVFENQEGSPAVGTLTVTDQNPVDTHSYSLPGGVTDNDLFSVSGTTLSATAMFDFETKDEYMVTVKVEDDQGSSYEEVFTINVLDVNDAPGATTPGSIEIVKDLGPLSFTVSGLNTGGETGQVLTASTTTTGVLSGASVVVSNDGSTAVVTFESTSGQEGTGNIELTVKDDGGTENGGVDTYVLDIPVTVSPANLTVTAAGSCGPGQVVLSASGADAYSWYNSALGGDVVGTGVELAASVTSTTTYYVAGTFSGEESLLRVPVLASVFDLPEIPIIVNNAEVLSVTEVAGATYAWFRNGTEVPDISGTTFAPTESGDYTAMITNENGCSTLSDPLTVIITGVEEDAPAIEVMVYPVPSSDYIHLSFGEVMLKGTEIRLLDNNGRELTRLVMKTPGAKVTLDVRSFASGIHFVLVQDGNKLVRKRVIIKK